MKHTSGHVYTLATVMTLAATLSGGTGTASGAASVMIWPINPVIAGGARSSALWLENRGATPVTFQIRVLGWTQRDHREIYDHDQPAVVGSPPLATIAPGKRQLVRLMRTQDAPPNREVAYRILIDEVPRPEETAIPIEPQHDTGLGVKLRMRYSVPLFVYGDGLDAVSPGARLADNASPGTLQWRVVDTAEGRFLQLRNNGSVHARLSDVQLVSSGERFDLARGLLGYVLPNSEMRWRLPDEAPGGTPAAVMMTVNGAPASVGPY